MEILDLSELDISVNDAVATFLFKDQLDYYFLEMNVITGDRVYQKQRYYELAEIHTITEATFIKHAKNCGVILNYTPKSGKKHECPIPFRSVVSFLD